jgi:hypothetical protein
VPTQTGYVLALFMDLVPEAFRQRVKDDFIARLEQDNTHLRTGFVGTPYLCRVLSNIGANDLAYKLLLNEDYPSWLYAINLDATTIWERLSICCAKKVFGRRAHRSKRWMIPENLSEFARPCQYPPGTGGRGSPAAARRSSRCLCSIPQRFVRGEPVVKTAPDAVRINPPGERHDASALIRQDSRESRHAQIGGAIRDER